MKLFKSFVLAGVVYTAIYYVIGGITLLVGGEFTSMNDIPIGTFIAIFMGATMGVHAQDLYLRNWRTNP